MGTRLVTATLVHPRTDARRSLTVLSRRDLVLPVALYGLVGAAVWLVVWFSAAHMSRHGLYLEPVATPGGSAIEGWVRWDAVWYRSIAQDGYSFRPGVQSSVAFFPAYPMMAGFAARTIPGFFGAAIAVTVVSGLVAVSEFWRWLAARFSRMAASTALALLLVYPFGWYMYGAVYADAFFLALVLGAFLAAERDRIWLAGTLAFVASAARPPGVLVAVCVVLLVIERRNESRALVDQAEDLTRAAARLDAAGVPGIELSRDRAGVGTLDLAESGGGSSGQLPPLIEPDLRGDNDLPVHRPRQHPPAAGLPRLRGRLGSFVRRGAARFDPRVLGRSDAPLLLGFGGLATFCLYLWHAFGRPFIFAEIQGVPGWDQPAGWQTISKVAMLNKWREDFFSDASYLMIVQALLTVVVLVLVPRIARRLGWTYAVYTLLVVLLPTLASKDMIGMGRYLLAAFPAFAVAGEILSRRPPWLARLVVGASFAALLAMASWFARGWYLS